MDTSIAGAKKRTGYVFKITNERSLPGMTTTWKAYRKVIL
jgi:hypothetical protein